MPRDDRDLSPEFLGNRVRHHRVAPSRVFLGLELVTCHLSWKPVPFIRMYWWRTLRVPAAPVKGSYNALEDS